MVRLKNETLARRTINELVATLRTDESFVLGELVARYGEDAFLYVTTSSYCYDEYETDVEIRRERLESDAEYEKRIAAARATAARAAKSKKAAKVARDNAERETYERLRKKFEKEG